MFLDFKIGVKSIQTAGYNGARTSVGFLNSLLFSCQSMIILLLFYKVEPIDLIKTVYLPKPGKSLKKDFSSFIL